MDPKSIFRGSLSFSLGQYIIQGTNLLKNFLIAGYLGPTYFGIWGIVTLVLKYTAYIDLGSLHAMNREIPALLSKEDYVSAQRIEMNTLALNLLFSIVCAIVLVAYSEFRSDDYMLGVGLLISAPLVVLQQVQNFSFGYLRSRQRFHLLNASGFAFAVCSFLIVLIWGDTGGISSVVVATLMGYFVAFALVSYWDPGWFRISLAWSLTKRSLNLGVSLLAYNLLVLVLSTADRIIAASELSLPGFGIYNFASMISNALFLIPSSFGLVMYPRIIEVYNKSKSVKSMKTLIEESNTTFALLMPLLVTITLGFVEVPVKVFFPEYMDALSLLSILSFGFCFVVTPINSVHLLIAMNKQNILSKLALLGISANICFVYGFGLRTLGDVGIALGSVLGFFIFGFLILLHVHRSFEDHPIQIVKSVLINQVPVLMSMSFYGVGLYLKSEIELGNDSFWAMLVQNIMGVSIFLIIYTMAFFSKLRLVVRSLFSFGGSPTTGSAV